MTIDVSDMRAYALQYGIPEADVLRIAIGEGFLRRAALVNGPFMLKGSYITRQLIHEGWRRIPGDLDWVGLGELDAGELTRWATAVSEIEIDDGISFRSFAENAFWRMIEYAMDEDFPTVNTDILAWVGEQPFEISIDVSFGLTLQPPPRSLVYWPQFGDTFVLPSTCPVELQIAWKLHQCMSSLRCKDVLDLILLLRDNKVDATLVWQALEDECVHDDTSIERFNWLFDLALDRHPLALGKAKQAFLSWRGASGDTGNAYLTETALAGIYLEGYAVPATFEAFLADLATELKRAGFHCVTPGAPDGDAAASPLSAPQAEGAGPEEEAAPNGIRAVLARWLRRH